MSATIPMPAAPSRSCTCQLCTGAGRSSYGTTARPRKRIEETGEDWRHAEIGELDD